MLDLGRKQGTKQGIEWRLWTRTWGGNQPSSVQVREEVFGQSWIVALSEGSLCMSNTLSEGSLCRPITLCGHNYLWFLSNCVHEISVWLPRVYPMLAILWSLAYGSSFPQEEGVARMRARETVVALWWSGLPRASSWRASSATDMTVDSSNGLDHFYGDVNIGINNTRSYSECWNNSKSISNSISNSNNLDHWYVIIDVNSSRSSKECFKLKL